MLTGIFGGTFDPPHKGHIKLADDFFTRLGLDRLIVIPTCVPPHKVHSDSASAEDRFNMARLAFESGKVSVSSIELKREGKSYTCDTVRELAELYPEDEFIFMIGSDMLLSFHLWREPKEILKYVRICAVSRSDGISRAELEEYVKSHFPEETERFITEDFEPIEISSTEIREAVRSGNGINDLVSQSVAEYIKERKLYI